MIPYGKQNISQDDIDIVTGVLESDWITQGPSIPAFEKKLHTYVNASYGVAVNSATSALHIACLALDLGAEDLLWTSPNSFVASANCALYCGAQVDFVDIDTKTYNMCADKLEEKLKNAKKIPKIVVPVHFSGQSCDMEKMKVLSEQYGFKIIEDASHAIGGEYQNNKIGSCEYSDITIFSFHPVKIITTGEGGMAVTNNHDLAEKMNLYRSHGVTRKPELIDKDNIDPWYYEQQHLGLNYRITDIQASLGISQLDRLDQFITKRHIIAKRYNSLLRDLAITTPYQNKNTYSSYHLYVIKVENRKQVFEHMRTNGIGVNVHYIPIHTHPYYKNLGFNWGNFKASEQYYEKTISLPMYLDLTES